MWGGGGGVGGVGGELACTKTVMNVPTVNSNYKLSILTSALVLLLC